MIEDILDSGNTLYFLKNYFMTKGAKSVKSAKGGKNAKPRVITARKRPKRTTKKAALS